MSLGDSSLFGGVDSNSSPEISTHISPSKCSLQLHSFPIVFVIFLRGNDMEGVRGLEEEKRVVSLVFILSVVDFFLHYQRECIEGFK